MKRVIAIALAASLGACADKRMAELQDKCVAGNQGACSIYQSDRISQIGRGSQPTWGNGVRGVR